MHRLLIFLECLIRDLHLIGTPFQLRVNIILFFNIDWEFSITQKTADCITSCKPICIIKRLMNVSHIQSKSRIFIQIIYGCLSEIQSQI